MDRDQNRGPTSGPPSTPSMSLPQDTGESMSTSWHPLVQRLDLVQQRPTMLWGRQLGYKVCPVTVSRRDAAVRHLSAFPYPTEQTTRKSTSSSSSKCDLRDDTSDASPVSLAWSVCYALLVILTAVFALSTGVVLVRLLPGANEAMPLPSPLTTGTRGVSSSRGKPGAAHNASTLKGMSKGRSEKATAWETDGRLTAALVKQGGPKLTAHATEADSEETRHLCGTVLYTYCPRPRHGFHFNRERGSCAASSYGAVVCNRGPNRFASSTSCRSSCVDTRSPQGRCVDRPLFSQCGSADLKTRLWFFEGEACRPWDFPLGRCPMADGDLFGSREACARKCLTNQTYYQPMCQMPSSGLCTIQQLKYPYFAVRLPGKEKMRCVKALALSLQKRLCLTGTNMFPSLASCNRACGHHVTSAHWA